MRNAITRASFHQRMRKGSRLYMKLDWTRRQWCVITIVVGAFIALSAVILGAVFHTEGGGANIGAGMVFGIGLVMFLSRSSTP